MRKDNIRDYATAAFRYYALYKQGAVQCITKAERLDVLAVEHTMQSLDGEHAEDIKRAVECIYFDEPGKPLRKNDISMRVISLTHELNMSERQIYRLLTTARRSFAVARGLRL